MTLDTLFLLIVTTYLVLIAYGVVGLLRRPLARRGRMVAAALMVLIPPAAVAAALGATGNPALLAIWGPVTFGMAVAGMLVAILTRIIARRIGR